MAWHQERSWVVGERIRFECLECTVLDIAGTEAKFVNLRHDDTILSIPLTALRADELPQELFGTLPAFRADWGGDWSSLARLNESRSLVRVTAMIDVFATLLPARIANEVLGDYLEDIHRRAAKGQRKLLYLRMLAAMFWTGVNAVGYWRNQLGLKKGA